MNLGKRKQKRFVERVDSMKERKKRMRENKLYFFAIPRETEDFSFQLKMNAK